MVIGCLEVRFLGALYVGSHSSVSTRGIWASISPDWSLICMSCMGICVGQCLSGSLCVRHLIGRFLVFFPGAIGYRGLVCRVYTMRCRVSPVRGWGLGVIILKCFTNSSLHCFSIEVTGLTRPHVAHTGWLIADKFFDAILKKIYLNIKVQGVFYNWCFSKSSKCFLVSKMF